MFLSSCLLHAQKYLSSIISYLHLFSRHKHYLKVQDLKLMSHSSFFPSSGYKLSSHSIKYSLFAQVAFKKYRNENVSFLHCQQILIIIFIKLKLLKFLLLCLSVIISSHPFFFFFAACKCNSHANVCQANTGKCFCTTKGVKGDQCQL